jgi:hypothetical protein
MPLLDEIFGALLDENGAELEDGVVDVVIYDPPTESAPTLWTWATFDARTYDVTGDVPMTAWQHEERLNTSGSWSATMQPPPSVLLARVALAATEPGKATIVPLRNGLPMNFDAFVAPGGRDVPELAGGNVTATLDLRALTATRTYTAVDQFAMVADLVNWCAGTSGMLVDTTQVGTSGVAVTQTWNDYELKGIGEAIRDKAALVDGFDWDIRTEIVSGVPSRILRTWYPRRGRYYLEQISPDFVVGGNVRNIPAVVSSSQFRTEAAGLGAETNSTTRARYVATQTSALLSEGYLMMSAMLDQSDAVDLVALQAAVDGEMRLHGLGADDIVLDVDPDDVSWPWGSWDLGDECRVVIPAGLSPWWPDGYSEVRRIVGHRWTFDADTGESLQVVTQRTV